LFLKRLEIVGFKSFADAFEMQFRPGITAVVGPNGAGKSNVADALRWVLGSQSPKQLRSERMEDVIFSGSAERKPLGMAEVVITFDNSSRALGLDFDEVCIARRLFRSGESEYLINGNRCRLMDITDLIVDRGLGSNGYWILTRNMVKTILSSRPEDRRFLFDEVAGITRYKIQRHRAELKLDATNEDLERIDDIMGEVRSTVAALKKQVSAFRRYEKAERRIAEIRGVMVSRRLREVGDLLSDAVLSRMKLESKREDMAAEMAAAEAALADTATESERAEAALEEQRERCSALEREQSALERELAVIQTRISSTSTRIEDADSLRREQRERARELGRRAEELRGRVKELQDSLEDYRRRAEEAAGEAEGARSRREEARKDLEAVRGELAEVRRCIADLEERNRSRLQRRERLEQELRSARERSELLEKRVSELKDSSKAAEADLEGLQGERGECAKELARQREKVAGLEEERKRLRDEIHGLEMDKAARRERLASLEEAPSSDRGRTLAESMSVRRGYGKAVGAFLDAFQDAEVLEPPHGGMEGDDGRRVALTGLEAPDRPSLPEGATWLPDLVDAPRDRFTALLSGGAVAPDRETALSWMSEGCGLDLVTTDGDLIRSGGLARLGISPASAGGMERRALAEETRRAISRLEEKVGEKERRASRLDEELQEAGDAETSLSDSLSDADSRLASARTRLDAIGENLEGAESELSEVASRVPELQEELSGLESGDSAGGMEGLRERRDGVESKVSRLEASLEEIGDEVGRLSARESTAAFDLRSREEELQRLQTDIDRLEKDAGAASRRAEESDDRIAELEEERRQLRSSVGEKQKLIREVGARREKAEEARTGALGRRGRAMEAMAEAQARVGDLRERIAEVRDRASQLEGRISTYEERLAGLKQSGGVLPGEGSRYWSMDDDQLQSNLDRQRGYRERLGPVNMLAVKEHEEASNRLGFLEEQRADLVEARDSLLRAISEINRTAARRFEKTFAEVRANFRELFVHLFGGGEADIMPLESEDPLEGGVQILARPAGKKLSNVAVLSDGEQALAAVALLFSLYLVKPSPFCVLDELDAPLDDSNIDRFVDLLHRFSEKTQFVVITHNKRTMEAADVLYGITMQEKGVSSAASVSLEEAST